MVYDVCMDNNYSQNFGPSEPVTPPQSVLTPEPTPVEPKNKTGKGWKILVTVIALIAIAALAYAVYAFMQNKSQEASISDKDQQIKTLNGQIATLQSGNNSNSATATTTPVPSTSTGTTIAFRELGISLTVPDSIKDLTYSYSSGSDFENVNLSTKAITDKYSNTNSCTSFGTAPPLGGMSKINGKPQGPLTGQVLVKQFSTYYITYSAPQSDCVDTQASAAAQIQALKDSFSTIKEL